MVARTLRKDERSGRGGRGGIGVRQARTVLGDFVVYDDLVGGGDGGCGWEVGVGDVLAELAVGVEEGAVDGDAVAHHFGPGGLVGVEGEDSGFELGVEVVGFCGFVVGVGDGPAGDAFSAAFDPPTVEDGERWDAVEGSLHAGGS